MSVLRAGVMLLGLLAGLGIAVFALWGEHEKHLGSSSPEPLPGERTTPLTGVVTPAHPVSPATGGYASPSICDTALADLVNRTAPLNRRIFTDMLVRFPEVKEARDLQALEVVLRDYQDDDTVRNEVASLLRRSHYAGLPDALIAVLENPAEGPRFRSFSVQHLGALVADAATEGRGKIGTRLRTALLDRHLAVRREALLVLVHQRDPAGVVMAVELLQREEEKNFRCEIWRSAASRS